MKPDDICNLFAPSDKKITIRLLDNDTVLLEGDTHGLEFLAHLLLAVAKAQDDGFQISPTGAGQLFFMADSSHGLYIHRVETEPNRLNESFRPDTN